MLLNDLLPQIKPGVIYLTYGTLEQIEWLTKAIGCTPEVIFFPNTASIRSALMPMILHERRAVVIVPQTLKTTGLVRINPKQKETYGTVKETIKGALPGDQFLQTDKNTYYFVCCLDAYGEKPKSKPVVGGLYKELNLLDVKFIDIPVPLELKSLIDLKYPYSTLRRIALYNQQGSSLGLVPALPGDDACKKLVQSLTTPSGPRAWYSICNSLFHSHFLTSFERNGTQTPTVLIIGRVFNLTPYLIEVLELIRLEVYDFKVGLSLFAQWVLLASTSWAEPDNYGLKMRTSKKKEPYWVFKPSIEARHKWNLLIDKLVF